MRPGRRLRMKLCKEVAFSWRPRRRLRLGRGSQEEKKSHDREQKRRGARHTYRLPTTED
jgi:hypothetical protein